MNNEEARSLIVSRSVLRQTHEYFYPYFEAGVETACFWFGVEEARVQIVTTIAVPALFQTAGNYRVDPDSWRRVVARMRRFGLITLAQVHTHPFDYGVKHSFIDDERSYSTAAGSLSIVWPDYGSGFDYRLASLGVHEVRDGVWELLTSAEREQRIKIVDDFADFRWAIRSGGISDSE
jgi:hypothetical protein